MAALYPLMVFFCVACALLGPGAMAANEQGCPEGWTLFGARCFKFFQNQKTWLEAEKSCHSLNANLASIHSAAGNDFIVDLIHRATGANTQTWLGGYDAVQEAQWLWSDGSAWDYTHWPSSGQPDNAGGLEHNLMINWDAQLWNDAPNSWGLAYVCSKDPPQTSVESRSKPGSVSMTLEGFVCHCTPP